jgi:hypothetical protein
VKAVRWVLRWLEARGRGKIVLWAVDHWAQVSVYFVLFVLYALSLMPLVHVDK